MKVLHLRKQPCLIALCAKARGTSVSALAWVRGGGQKKNALHPSAPFIPRIRREHRNMVARMPSSKPGCENVGGRARLGERERQSVLVIIFIKGVKELFGCVAMRVSEALFTAITQYHHEKKHPTVHRFCLMVA